MVQATMQQTYTRHADDMDESTRAGLGYAMNLMRRIMPPHIFNPFYNVNHRGDKTQSLKSQSFKNRMRATLLTLYGAPKMEVKD